MTPPATIVAAAASSGETCSCVARRRTTLSRVAKKAAEPNASTRPIDAERVRPHRLARQRDAAEHDQQRAGDQRAR